MISEKIKYLVHAIHVYILLLQYILLIFILNRLLAAVFFINHQMALAIYQEILENFMLPSAESFTEMLF